MQTSARRWAALGVCALAGAAWALPGGTVTFCDPTPLFNNSTSSSIALNPVSSGDLIVVVTTQSGSGAGLTSMTDSQGTAFTRAFAPQWNADLNMTTEIWYRTSTTTGLDTVNMTYPAPGAGGPPAVRYWLQYPGFGSPVGIDVAAAMSAAGTLLDAGTLITSGTGDLLVAYAVQTGNVTSGPTGFTPRSQLCSPTELAADLQTTGPGTFTGEFLAADSGAWTAVMVVFKADAGLILPLPDAGPSVDAGAPPDAGPYDGGPTYTNDGGRADAGATADAGNTTDGGRVEDAGTPDAGLVDAGTADAGPDDAGSGHDAGTPDSGHDAQPDSGAADSGASDGQNLAWDPQVNVGCGCDAGASPLLLGLAVLLARRRARGAAQR